MDELYDLVQQAKKRQNIQTDRGFAIANGINPQVIVDLKAGKSGLNAENMLLVLSAAGLKVEDGIKAIKRQKEAGFANLGLLLGLSAGSFGAMSLVSVTSPSQAAIGAALTAGGYLFIHYAKYILDV